MNSFKNTKKQGDTGLGAAIFHFTKLGQTVAIPLTDSQGYDLIADFDGSLKKIKSNHVILKENTLKSICL